MILQDLLAVVAHNEKAQKKKSGSKRGTAFSYFCFDKYRNKSLKKYINYSILNLYFNNLIIFNF